MDHQAHRKDTHTHSAPTAHPAAVRTSPPKSEEPGDDAPTFRVFALADPLLRGLQASGFSEPTEIQAKALPVVLKGLDVMASAQTGTGKTAAFVLPALQLLLKPSTKSGRGPRVLVLTPTRELAGQVESVVHELGRFARLKIGSIVGGVSYMPQERLLRSALDLLVATPGRLIDHMEKGLVDFGRLELFVLDEADRMLDMGFIKPVKHIAAALPPERQTLLFSATLEGEVLRVAKQLMRDPVAIQLATAKMRHESITHRVIPATSADHKLSLLAHLLEDPSVSQAIVFAATKRGAGKLAKRLISLGHKSAALHGNMRQSARNRTVDLLRSGEVRLIVATDVAARGIDVEGITHVINFNLPTVAEDYIHRTGRTGRNGATGIAISLVDGDDRTKLASIERLLGRRLEQQHVANVRPIPRPESEPARKPQASSGHSSSGSSSSDRSNSGHGGSGHSGSSHSSSGATGSGRSSSGHSAQGQGRPSSGNAQRNHRRSNPSRHAQGNNPRSNERGSNDRSNPRSEPRDDNRGNVRPVERVDTRDDNRGNVRTAEGGGARGQDRNRSHDRHAPRGPSGNSNRGNANSGSNRNGSRGQQAERSAGSPQGGHAQRAAQPSGRPGQPNHGPARSRSGGRGPSRSGGRGWM